MSKAFRVGPIKDGEVFVVGGVEFIKFSDVCGKTPAVAKDVLFRSRFGDDNDLTKSVILKKLQEEVLPKIIAEVGEENVCLFETDLTTLDGLKPYPVLESRISLPTLDFYRANVEIFDKHKPGVWWWLATPESAKPHGNPWWTLCVSPGGIIYGSLYYFDSGVRPFCMFESSIFDPCEEE